MDLIPYQGVIGLVGLVAIAWLVSEDRRAIRWRVPLIGFALQFLIALLMLKLPQSRHLFTALNEGVLALQAATEAGTSFVFGYLGGDTLPFEETEVGSSFVFAFRSLPLIIVVSALTALLSYWRVLPLIVNGLSFLLARTLGVGGAVALSAAANIFVGMVEAPLFIRNYLLQLSRSELFMVMTCGMATIAGTVLVLYTTMLAPVLDDAVGHLLTASIISAPAAIMFAWLMVPLADGATQTQRMGLVANDVSSTMDAITRGTERGLSLFLNILAMLIVLVALVQLLNAVLGLLPDVAGQALSLERMLGWIFAPITWSLGIPWNEATTAGGLLGIKTALNELLAYQALAALPADAMSGRSTLIMSYALCGMANFGSLGIMIGGFTVMVPERRREVVSLGLKSIVAGTLATCSTGAVVGLIG
jgi:CNT family concentrative nucleoside transporter